MKKKVTKIGRTIEKLLIWYSKLGNLYNFLQISLLNTKFWRHFYLFNYSKINRNMAFISFVSKIFEFFCKIVKFKNFLNLVTSIGSFKFHKLLNFFLRTLLEKILPRYLRFLLNLSYNNNLIWIWMLHWVFSEYFNKLCDRLKSYRVELLFWHSILLNSAMKNSQL